MKLQEIFDQLSASEFSMISLGGQAQGEINENNWGKLISHINLGLTALYTRFTLKENYLKLNLQAGQVSYPLTSNYAVNARKARADIRYILDTPTQPFSDDILKITKVETDDGIELDLNDQANRLSILTPTTQMLRVPLGLVNGDLEIPEAMRTNNLLVTYRASHPQVVQSLGFFDPSRVDIELPYSHLTALLWFVASRAHNPIGMGQEFNSGNTYYAKYEAECQGLEGKGLQVDQGQQSSNFERNGWV